MTPATAGSRSVVCYVRRTKAWAERYEFSEAHRQTWHVGQIARAWDTVFTLSYVDFRRRLHELQCRNFRDVPFDVVVNQYAYTARPGATVVPTDDDDWFHPDLVEVLRSTTAKVVYWNFINYTHGAVTVQDSTQARVQFESNNYALTPPESLVVLQNHVQANSLYRNRRGQHIPRGLSVHNRTLASLGLLCEHLRDLPTGLRQLYEIYAQPPQIGADVPEYFLQHIEAMQRIYRDELRPRRSHF